jgi:hypothetical protein
LCHIMISSSIYFPTNGRLSFFLSICHIFLVYSK